MPDETQASSMMRTRVSIAVLAAGASLFAAAAVEPSSARITRISNGGTFRMNISGTDVQSLDPALDYEVFGGQIILATCARLFSYPSRPGRAGSILRPEVA